MVLCVFMIGGFIFQVDKKRVLVVYEGRDIWQDEYGINVYFYIFVFFGFLMIICIIIIVNLKY